MRRGGARVNEGRLTQAMIAAFRVFISCVSREFGSYREDLRKALTSAGREIKIQEDFVDGPGTLLEKLDDYLTKCQSVIHLVGEGAGVKPKPAEIRWLLAKYPDFPRVLPELERELTPDGCPFSYTQWECFLALYHRIPCYIYLAEGASRRETGWTPTPESAAEQQAHIERLVKLGHDRRKEVFSDARDIAIRFFNAYYDAGGHVPAYVPAAKVFHWPQMAPLRRPGLADRDRERKAFQSLVTGQSHERVLLIHGPSDRGKSVLLFEFFEIAKCLSGLGVAHAEFKTALPLGEVLADARRDLRFLRFPRFDRELGQDRRPEMLRAAFLEDIEESPEPVLLIFDAFEQATEDAKRWVEDQLLPPLPAA